MRLNWNRSFCELDAVWGGERGEKMPLWNRSQMEILPLNKLCGCDKDPNWAGKEKVLGTPHFGLPVRMGGL